MEDYCRVYQKRCSLILYILGSLAVMCVASVYMLNANLLSDECSMQSFRGCCFENPIFYYTLGRGLMVYFGFCIAVFIFLLIKPYCLFYLNDKGFWAQDYGFIEWENVEDISIENIGYQTVIVFKPKDSSSLSIPLWKKFIKFFNKNKYFIELTGNFDEVNEVYKLMRNYV